MSGCLDVTKSGGALANSSNTAFGAADNIAAWIPKDKHLLDSTAKRPAKFNTNSFDDIRSMVAEALNSPSAKFLPNGESADSFRVIADMGREVGTKGQTSIRAAVGNDGKIWTAPPAKNNFLLNIKNFQFFVKNTLFEAQASHPVRATIF